MHVSLMLIRDTRKYTMATLKIDLATSVLSKKMVLHLVRALWQLAARKA